MLNKILNKIIGDPNQKIIRNFQPLVDEINHLEPEVSALSDQDLRARTDIFRQQLAAGVSLDDLLPDAFATVREAAKRTLGQRHFDVQLIGGICLHKNMIAEMKTGEGKTLVATLPAYLNALTGQGVHVVTVNDYLAKRDSDWMGTIYKFLGLTVGAIVNGLPTSERRDVYNSDITYGTNNEFGFDYLRDNMANDASEMVQRDLHYAIIDEVDSILIDEARTPLIISTSGDESTEKYVKYAGLIPHLNVEEDYAVDEKARSTALTEAGITKLEQLLGVDNIYTEGGLTEVHHIEQALKAHAIFKRDIDYVVKDGEVMIVDEFTGRLMHGRRYSDGLHQAIEAKEHVTVRRESKTLATITFQNYFRIYDKLSGMTGTAITEAEEFAKIYNLNVLVIPTNKPVTRIDQGDVVYKNEAGKFQAIASAIHRESKTGRPILVGTISIEKSEALSALLHKENIHHQVLNAKHHEQEAEIVAQAGRKKAVTIATNMAGRGTDIMLGGNPEFLAKKATADLESADYEKHLTHFKSICQQEHQEVLDLGGLCIIGTERHESRRIDNQLRGRAGRQGDPGSTQFFISMGDPLMRMFGSDRIQKIMTSLGIPDDMPIENRMITKSIESAQRKVEGHHFDIRKHVLEYDEVLNKHRSIIYGRRRDILHQKDIHKLCLQTIEDEITELVHNHVDRDGQANTEHILNNINTILDIATHDLVNIKNTQTLTDKLVSLLTTAYNQHFQDIPTEYLQQLERNLMLRTIDIHWMEHLDSMTHLRDSVSLHGYGQRDPLLIYKDEAYRAFATLLRNIQSNFVHTIFKMQVEQNQAPLLAEDSPPPQNIVTNHPDVFSPDHQVVNSSAQQGDTHQGEALSTTKQVGRNQPCPCGSGKKYKKCCGRNN